MNNKACSRSGETEAIGKCQATLTKDKKHHDALHPLVGFESSLYYYVTRSHHLHLVHHKWTDVIEEGATGPLDSLLRDLTRWWGSPEWGPRMGTAIHCAHAHTHRDICGALYYTSYI